jgi:2-amino-4-hydroxy-6-hydroxymethyldihydropteridine diphosphokinase
MGNIVLLGIGSNLGNKIGNCKAAIDRLGDLKENRIIQRSSFYETDPVGYLHQDWFVNCVIKFETAFRPHELLGSLQKLEKTFGRQKTVRWGPRLIDLDILLFNREEFVSRDLHIPHPHLHERAFVLVPLCEIDPAAFHPGLRKTARELLEDLGDIEGVKKL